MSSVTNSSVADQAQKIREDLLQLDKELQDIQKETARLVAAQESVGRYLWCADKSLERASPMMQRMSPLLERRSPTPTMLERMSPTPSPSPAGESEGFKALEPLPGKSPRG